MVVIFNNQFLVRNQFDGCVTLCVTIIWTCSSCPNSNVTVILYFQKVPKPNFGTKTTEDTKLRFFVGFLFLSCSLLIGGAHVLYYQHLGEVRQLLLCGFIFRRRK